MQATDASTLFQSSEALALGQARSLKATRTSSGALYGSPIWLGQRYKDTDLASSGAGADAGSARILSLRSRGDELWTSESGGVIRRMDAESGKTLQLFRGHTAPVPAFDWVGDKVCVSGSWDKSLKFWVIGDREAVATVEGAGTDFIKTVHAFKFEGKDMLLSSGSDKTVRCWDLSPLMKWNQDRQGLAPKVEAVASLREHSRPVNVLASLEGTPYLYSADSMGRIFEMILDLSAPSVSSRLKIRRELMGHETSIYDMKVGWREEEVHSLDLAADEFTSAPSEGQDGSFTRKVGEVWTCSGDRTARLFTLPGSLSGARNSKAGPAVGALPPLGPSLTIQHTDFVKSLLPISHYSGQNLLVTGSADEHVRIFNLDESAKLINEIEGHWHEVDAICAWYRPRGGDLETPKQGGGEWWVVSGSLDGSVRRWSVSELLKPRPKPVPAAKEQPQGPKAKVSTMTAEEEQELADLMGSVEDM